MSRSNRDDFCTACAKQARNHLAEPPRVEVGFWQTPEMRAALDARNMGAVMRAFRTHPQHAKDISQAVAATWVGLTQPHLSRLENGPAFGDLDKLMHWANVLRIPADLLWFKLPVVAPGDTKPSAMQPDADVDAAPSPQTGAVLPVLLDGRQVLVPLDAEMVERGGLGPLLDEFMARASSSGGGAASSTGWNQMSPLSRRQLLTHGVAAAALPALGLEEVGHVAAALDDARRYLDGSVVEYFRRCLDESKSADGDDGPKKTLPRVLSIVNAVELHARDVKPEVRRSLLRVGAEGAEFAGWLYRDVQNPMLASFWRDRAMEWAQEAGDLPMQGYMLLKKAQAAYDERDASRMLCLAEAAASGPWQLPIKVRADVAQQEARGHAMLGDDNALVARKLDEAQELLASATSGGDGEQLGAHYNQTLLTMQTAICFTEAGQPRRAAELYEEWLSSNRFSRRDYGYFLSLMASSLALAGEPDAAAATALRSLTLAQETNSKRTTQEIGKVLLTLQPWENRAKVRELREAVRAG